MTLRKPLYLPIDDGDALGLRTLRQSWHTEHIACNSHNHLTATVEDHITDADSESLRRPISRGVGRERELCFGDAYWVLCDGAVLVGKIPAQRLELFRHSLTVFYTRSTVDTLAHLLYLVFQTSRPPYR